MTVTAKNQLAGNPLAEVSTLPFELPDFAAIKFEHLEPALEAGFIAEAEQWREIAENPEPPTVENTVWAVDDAGALLSRASAAFGALAGSVGGADLDALQEKMAPKFAAHSDQFWMDPKMYARYRALSELPDLDEETAWLVAETVTQFELSGVNLAPKQQERVRELNNRTALLEARIDARISRQLAEVGLEGDRLEQLRGLGEDAIELARQRGAERGAAWFLPIQNFTSADALAHLEDPETRAQLLEVSLGRGLGEDPDSDTRELIIELAVARAERAELLGFDSHAHLVTAEETVPSPEAAIELLQRLGRAAAAGLQKERGLLGEAASADQVTAADWPYFERQMREELLGIDPEQLRPYFPLSQVIEDGVFYAATELFGLQFQRRPELRGVTEDAEVWEVQDEDGTPLGLFVADFYARPGKSGGAWMNGLVEASGRHGTRPVIINETNFHREADGGEPLLNWDQVETCFHEFGHALHGLLTATQYRATEGTNVPRDFVELPSQLNEMWAYHPQVLKKMARHFQTGAPLDTAIIDKLAQSRTVLQSYSTMEQVAAALLDQAWHSFPTAEAAKAALAGGVEGFESDALAEFDVANPLVPPRYRSAYFAHIFTVGYDAAFYSYTWAETLVAEMENWFRQQANQGEDGGLNREAGEQLRREILSRGNSRNPLDGFIALRGHEPRAEAIIARRGLEEEAS